MTFRLALRRAKARFFEPSICSNSLIRDRLCGKNTYSLSYQYICIYKTAVNILLFLFIAEKSGQVYCKNVKISRQDCCENVKMSRQEYDLLRRIYKFLLPTPHQCRFFSRVAQQLVSVAGNQIIFFVSDASKIFPFQHFVVIHKFGKPFFGRPHIN